MDLVKLARGHNCRKYRPETYELLQVLADELERLRALLREMAETAMDSAERLSRLAKEGGVSDG